MNNGVKKIRLGFVGDIGLGQKHSDLCEKDRGTYLHEKMQSCFEDVDVIIGNLECSILKNDTVGKMTTNLYAVPAALECIKGQTNIHVCLANNHIADFGDYGVCSTIKHLDNAGIPHFGAGSNDSIAISPHIIDILDTRIGLICGSDFKYSNATKKSAGSAPYNIRRLTRQITELKRSCKYVIVILHADEEFNNIPSPYRIRHSRSLIDAGADAVIQHHPHVVQGVEIYKGCTIAYSLGNWAFDLGDYQSRHIQTKYGILLVLEFSDGENVDQSYSVTHTLIDEHHRPIPLSHNDAEVQQARFEQLSASIDNAREVKRNWLETCRKSVVKETFNLYYTLKKYGVRLFCKRLKHLINEPLYRRQLLGLITFGKF